MNLDYDNVVVVRNILTGGKDKLVILAFEQDYQVFASMVRWILRQLKEDNLAKGTNKKLHLCPQAAA